MRGPVFALPAAPPAWDRDGITLIRIVDPLGAAIAWFAPDFGASCVGYTVRRDDEWRQVFGVADFKATPTWPLSAGCAVVGSIVAPGADTTGPAEQPSRPRVWQFVERDPTAAVFETTLTASQPTGSSNGDNTLRLRLAACLQDAALSLCLDVFNDGEAAIAASIGLQAVVPVFADLGGWQSLWVGSHDIPVDEMLRSDMAPVAAEPVTLALGATPAQREEVVLIGKDAGTKLIMEHNVGIHTVSLSSTPDSNNVVVTLRAASVGESTSTLQSQSRSRIATTISVRVG